MDYQFFFPLLNYLIFWNYDFRMIHPLWRISIALTKRIWLLKNSVVTEQILKGRQWCYSLLYDEYIT